MPADAHSELIVAEPSGAYLRRPPLITFDERLGQAAKRLLQKP